MLKIENVSVKIERAQLLESVSLSVKSGSVLAVLGPNGAGKSTLMDVVCGVRKPSQGRVLLGEREVASWRASELACHRAVVAQRTSLSFPFQVFEVVMLGRSCLPLVSPLEEDARVVEEALSRVEMLSFAHRRYTTLSGGERKRVHIARALAQLSSVPRADGLLVLDEPMASLDLRHQRTTSQLLRELADDGLCVVVVLHDWNIAARLADTIAVLAGGRLIAHGSPAEVLTPRTLHQVYGIHIDVLTHPDDALPIIIPGTGETHGTTPSR